MELIASGLLGSVLGGVFRLAPEVLKWLDRKNERSHELEMFRLQTDLEKQRGAQKLAEIGAQHEAAIDTGVMDAFGAALRQQTEMVKVAGAGWIAALSASVRPVMTYYLLALYGAVKVALFMTAGGTVWENIVNIYTTDDFALLCGVVNYWIMDRTLAKRGLA